MMVCVEAHGCPCLRVCVCVRVCPIRGKCLGNDVVVVDQTHHRVGGNVETNAASR